MIAFFIRVFSFFMKEFHDVRRQPLLVISLVGGPLLVLAAFGLTFQKSNPFITTILVWPENGIPGFTQEQAADFIGQNFTLVYVTSDKEEAMKDLDSGLVDVVQIIPEISSNLIEEGERPEIQIFSRTIDPTTEAWTRSLAYGEANFINKQILTSEAKLAQTKALEVSASLSDAQTNFLNFYKTFDSENFDNVLTSIGELRTLVAALEAFLPPPTMAQANLAPELNSLHHNIQIMIDDLDELKQALETGDLTIKLERLQSTSDQIGNLRLSIDTFAETPAASIITPIRETYTNLRGEPYPMVVFFAPAVLALLLQQMAITLGSLGLVRERQMGSFEMFRVSPVRFIEILFGKSLAYILYATIVGILLTGLLTLIKVPLPVFPLKYLGLMVLTATASVGIGFLVSALSRTDSQAVQMTMLILLTSIFFTGFFLPITGFQWPAWIIYSLLPMSSAIRGFKDFLLVGRSTYFLVWFGLSMITLLSYGTVIMIMRRQYRKVLD